MKETVKGYCKESKCEYDVYTKEHIDELIASIESKIPTLTFDDTPTKNSTNPVKSNGLYTSLEEIKESKLDSSRISYGTSLPASGNEGDIFLKY